MISTLPPPHSPSPTPPELQIGTRDQEKNDTFFIARKEKKKKGGKEGKKRGRKEKRKKGKKEGRKERKKGGRKRNVYVFLG